MTDLSLQNFCVSKKSIKLIIYVSRVTLQNRQETFIKGLDSLNLLIIKFISILYER